MHFPAATKASSEAIRFMIHAAGWLALTLALVSCSAKSPASKAQPAIAAASRVWPPPPDQPRIAYVQSIRHPGDAGIKRSAVTRFARWIVGNTGETERLNKPFGIAVDENDNVCITDTGSNSVIYWDRARQKWQRWEKLGKNFRFSSPVAVAKRNGIFYVADSALGTIVAFDLNGTILFQVTEGLQRPSGVAVSATQLIVADSLRHRVIVFDLDGRQLLEFGQRGTGEGEFNYPTHAAADIHGNLFITDSMNSRVQAFDRHGKFLAQIGQLGNSPGEFSRPKGVASDPFGNVYVPDALFDSVQIFNREGQLLLNFGESGDGPGQFWLPNGIAISGGGEIFIADSYNRRVQILKYVGKQ